MNDRIPTIDGERLRAERLDAPAVRYRGDEGLRQRIEAGGAGAEAAKRELGLPPDADVRFVANTDEIVHFVMPPNPNAALEDAALTGVVGGSSVGTAGSVLTVSSAPSCFGCGSTASTAGCADIGL